jgi:hypothetical protein
MFIQPTCAVLGYCTASIGNFLPTFWDNLSVPSSWSQGFFSFLTLKNRSDSLSQKSLRNYHHSLCNNPEESSSHLLFSRSLKPRMSVQSLGCTTEVVQFCTSNLSAYLQESKNNNQLNERRTVAPTIIFRAAVQQDQ